LADTPESKDVWFVTQRVQVPSGDNKGGTITFQPGEALRVSQVSGSRYLVVRWFGYETPVWIPRKYLARLSSFTPIHAWHGDKQYEIEAGDYSGTYEFHADGTFKLVETESIDSPGGEHYEMVTRRGRLYQMGNAVWARVGKRQPRNADAQGEVMHMFWRRPDGSLCFVYLGPCEDH
jgi:hypothetical protein